MVWEIFISILIIRNHSHEILVGSNVWLLIDEWWFAIYSFLASIYSTGMCVTPSCCARHTRSNFAMLWNQLLTVLAWLWFYCWMHFNCIYRPEVLQLIYIRFNVMMSLSNPTMNNVSNIPLVFICVHNTILCFYHIMSLCFRCWCTLSEMTRIKMINQSINISNNTYIIRYDMISRFSKCTRLMKKNISN